MKIFERIIVSVSWIKFILKERLLLIVRMLITDRLLPRKVYLFLKS